MRKSTTWTWKWRNGTRLTSIEAYPLPIDLRCRQTNEKTTIPQYPCPVVPRNRHPDLLQEGDQQARVAILFADQFLVNPGYPVVSAPPGRAHVNGR
jgi:hypothetical protein